MNKLTGLIPVLISPITEDDCIDRDALEKLCLKYKSLGVKGLWVLGTGGEDMCLTYDDRLQVTQTVSEVVGYDLDLIVGCSFFSPKETLKFIDATSNFKIKAYHAMPYHQKVSLNQIKNWYKDIADYSTLPLWCYTSGNWAKRMPPEFIRDLKNHPNIQGVKYSSSNILDIQGAIELQDDKFQVITAVVKSLYSCLSLGVKAATTIEANLFCPYIQQIFTLFEQGLYEEALKKQQFLNNSLLNYPSPATKDNFLRISEIKFLMNLRDLTPRYVTKYYRQLSSSEEGLLLEFFEKYKKELAW